MTTARIPSSRCCANVTPRISGKPEPPGRSIACLGVTVRARRQWPSRRLRLLNLKVGSPGRPPRLREKGAHITRCRDEQTTNRYNENDGVNLPVHDLAHWRSESPASPLRQCSDACRTRHWHQLQCKNLLVRRNVKIKSNMRFKQDICLQEALIAGSA